MGTLSDNIRDKLNRLQAAQRKALDELEESKKQEVNTIMLRLDKTTREKEDMEIELKKYVEMYQVLEKYFKSPHDGTLFSEKSQNSIYEVLTQVVKSNIHIF